VLTIKGTNDELFSKVINVRYRELRKLYQYLNLI